ncbi:hypothetical protein B296_00011732, partial [Ensete ventricosum]
PVEESCVRGNLAVTSMDSHDTPGPTLGMLRTSRPVAFDLSRRQPPAVRGAAGWSTRHIQPATLLAVCWQGCRRLVGPLCLLCPIAGQLSVGVLPCYRSPVVRYAASRSGLNTY